MKFIKTITAIVIATCMGVAAMAQKLNSTQLPVAVKVSFEKAYPAVKPLNGKKKKAILKQVLSKGRMKYRQCLRLMVLN